MLPSVPGVGTVATFRPADRAVDNWHREAAFALDLSPEAAFTLLAGDDIRGVTRCVKLNNFWCIKRAGWAGEIAADGEGHVAFASAREGAAVAALLLRRYYMDFGLKSARAIVARWAPLQCGTIARAGAPRILSASLGGGLARRGLGNTLRAKWLATHTIGGFAKASPMPKSPGSVAPKTPQAGRSVSVKRRSAGGMPRRSAVPDLVGPLLATPTIMVGFGAPAGAKPAARLAMLATAGIPMGPTPGTGSALPPLTSCASDGARLANYAAKASDGVGAGPDSDLGLFAADGTPTDNLVKVLANMAAVEIGPLRASDAVIRAGVAALVARKASN